VRGLVLDNISLQINTGDKIALIGANGAGKTTLMQLLVGLILKQQGDIFGFTKPILTEADYVFLRREVGFVFQDPDDQLFCPSVLEDVMFGPLNQGFNSELATKKSLDMLSVLNLSHLANRIASDLSGGEKRMVTLAAVLVMQPKVLLLDEPTNALDAVTKANLLTLLQSLDQAMLIISHDQAFLAALTNKVIELKDATLSPFQPKLIG
jgi:cobalt/nickel transport system ATP-binding protein